MPQYAFSERHKVKRKDQSMRILFGLLLWLPILLWGGLRIYNDIDYSRKIGGHLKRAADANTVDLAKKELTFALTEIEHRGWDKGGYTNILWTTPAGDVGFWYENLKSSLKELEALSEDSSELTRSNMLIKLRETLLDHGSEGSETVTEPHGISIFPNNVGYCLMGWGGVLSALIGSVLIYIGVDARRHGVTLIEVLVVVSIIGILGTILVGTGIR